MRVAAFTGYGGPEDLEVQERPDPQPGDGEAVVRVEAASLNHRDLWKVKDDSADRDEEVPFVAGGDLAGVVIETGAGTDVDPGDRVVLCPLETCGECRFCREGPENMCEEYGSFDGAFAERALVDASRLVPLPDSVSFEQAAALPIAYMTAYRMLKRGRTTAGDLVFVPGATGGVGIASVQLAGVMGAAVIGTSSSARKLGVVEDVGLDHGIRTSDAEYMQEAVSEIGPVDVTINHLGGPYTAVGAEVLRTDGTMVICGRTAGQFPEVDVRDLYYGHKRILGSTLAPQPDLERLVDFVAEGAFDPVVARSYPLAETEQAFRDMQERDMVGKLLVNPQE